MCILPPLLGQPRELPQSVKARLPWLRGLICAHFLRRVSFLQLYSFAIQALHHLSLFCGLLKIRTAERVGQYPIGRSMNGAAGPWSRCYGIVGPLQRVV